MQTRRDFLKTMGTAGLAAALYGCSSLDPMNNYTHGDKFLEFTGVLGEQWYNLPEANKNRTRALWREATEEDKELILDIYKSPKDDYKSLDKDVQTNITKILEYQNSGKKIKDNPEYQEIIELSAQVPWINQDNVSKADMVFLGTLAQALAMALMG